MLMMDLLEGILIIHGETYKEVLFYQHNRNQQKEEASLFAIPILHLLSTPFFWGLLIFLSLSLGHCCCLLVFQFSASFITLTYIVPWGNSQCPCSRLQANLNNMEEARQYHDMQWPSKVLWIKGCSYSLF